MIKFFKNLFDKKNIKNESDINKEFDIHSTSLILAYEVARSDGEIDTNEIEYLKSLIDDSECKDEILNQLENLVKIMHHFIISSKTLMITAQ